MSVTAYLALGSNMGDRAGNLQAALDALRAHPQIGVLEASCLYETEPVGMESSSGWFLNMAAGIETTLSPGELLDLCLAVERHAGRIRPGGSGYADRTLDIDILFYGTRAVSGAGLTIPHPRLQDRAFVLVPLLELAPDFTHPLLEKTVSQLHLELACPEIVRVFREAPPIITK